MAHADTFTQVDLLFTNISLVTTPQLDGNILWDTTATFKNNGPSTLSNLYFIWLANSFFDPGPAAYEPAAWDDVSQKWAYNSATLQNAYGQPVNAAVYVLMSPSDTDISIPPAVLGSHLPAYSISSSLDPGQSATFHILEELTPNITNSIGPSYAVVSASTPEPGALTLAAIGGLGLLLGKVRSKGKLGKS